MSEVTDIAIVGALLVGGYFLYKAYKDVTGAFGAIGGALGQIPEAAKKTTSAVIAPGGNIQTPNTMTNSPLPDIFQGIYDYGYSLRAPTQYQINNGPTSWQYATKKQVQADPRIIQPWV